MTPIIRLALLIGASWAMAASGEALPPSPLATVTGPDPVTPQSGQPYRAEPSQRPSNLSSYGYVEDEYFVSGSIDGQPYTTSILVRKPSAPDNFSGVVVLETLHFQGNTPFWSIYRDRLMSDGHAWVMVTSQRSPLEMYVRKSNAARYASLQIPDAGGAPANPLAGGPQDAISQAILTQVGALLKSNAGDTVLAGMAVKYLVMAGVSQTGVTTLHYIQESHAKARLANDRPIYDGYFPAEAFVSGPISGGDAAVIHVVGEGDFALFGALDAQNHFSTRADSDAPSDRFREYQFPAGSHVPTRGATDARMIIGAPLAPNEQLSLFPSNVFYYAAFANLVDWITKGIIPPRAPAIAVRNGEIERDAFGNAKGGVRTPYVDVPTVRYIASAPTPEGDNPARRMIGLQEPLSQQKLRNLYKSRENYLKRFDREIDHLVAQRWLQAKDGETLKADEAKIPLF
jgi:Alpha/beta hydrolase domain